MDEDNGHREYIFDVLCNQWLTTNPLIHHKAKQTKLKNTRHEEKLTTTKTKLENIWRSEQNSWNNGDYGKLV